MIIHWYPGHIAKAERQLREKLKLVDAVVELVDARLPLSTHFQLVDDIISQKDRVMVLNKTDLSFSGSPHMASNYWIKQGIPCVYMNALKGKGKENLLKELNVFVVKLHKKMKARGRLPRKLRVMVLGLPNVGKSSLINRLINKRSMKVQNKPGVTRSQQWVRLGKDLELMDTPGVIPTKLEDQNLALKLALIGSVSNEAYDPIRAARLALDLFRNEFPGFLTKVYGSEDATLKSIGTKRQFKQKGDEIDIERTAKTLFFEMRTGQLGPILLESPEIRELIGVQQAF